MYELIYKVSADHEEQITDLLIEKNLTSFYFEVCGDKLLLFIYLESGEPPVFLDKSMLQSVKEVDQSSWSRMWGESYTGHELTGNIFVLPSEITPPDKKYKTIIEIDPFDSFGDGHHPTTRLCGRLLESVIDEFSDSVNVEQLSMIDVGTGSGILAIAAWSLGVRDIELFDYEPVAVEKALKNLKLNGIDSLNPFVGDIYSFSTQKKYDIVTANLLSRIIEDNITHLISMLKRDGKLILSGISTLWTDEMKKLFIHNNLEIFEHKILEEWNGFVLIRKK